MRFYLSSSIGLKTVVAATGLMMYGFVVAHLSGNLLAYKGAEEYNAYAFYLQSLGPLLWVARIALLGIFVVHVAATTKLVLNARAARGSSYVKKQAVDATWASRSMALTGTIILFFILFHLAHFTFEWVGGDIHGFVDSDGRRDAYRMLVLGLSVPLIAILYMVANVFLGFHLYHGLQSTLQSLGINNDGYRPIIKKTGAALAWIIAMGNVFIPVSILMGVIG